MYPFKHEPDSFSPPKSTLSLQTAATPAAAGGASGTPESHQTPYQSNSRGRGRTRAGRHRGGSGRGRGRGNGSKGSNDCILCSKRGHWAGNCLVYTDAEKRERLMYLNLCIACGQPKHPSGEQCHEAVKCLTESHRGQRHYQYTCGGSPHPGIQT